jgi:hypothetical protein
MVSEMATRQEVSCRYVVEINVTVELKKGDGRLRCGWKYLELFWGGKEAQDWRNRWLMVPGIGEHF